jgi:hypothetical protein
MSRFPPQLRNNAIRVEDIGRIIRGTVVLADARLSKIPYATLQCRTMKVIHFLSRGDLKADMYSIVGYFKRLSKSLQQHGGSYIGQAKIKTFY